ncbi:N-acetylmuramoyl-L-alanine amidase family protein [Pelovirga terrestris]|uniref:N-acetylmuramoyl-L-alanine amidase n=1 Tax=Pelovirga terrestris TaxID=2771352 RepID=A0A8J6QWL9_9BACT|nr:N-acetylmuramoyl-L-alanine amidase [Pelovirga terrestris]MBD1399192.1 N-acetylmuramoyl-L-alanine amidase [Pelovirga terrestris]
MRLILLCCCFLLISSPVGAAVEIALRGQPAIIIEDVYRQQGVSYVAIEDLLDLAGLAGHWDSVAHTYRIRTSRGWVVLTPASGYMQVGDNFYPLQEKPVFIDGRLRVSENFIQAQLAQLAGRAVFFRHLNPQVPVVEEAERDGIDELFSRFFRRAERSSSSGPTIRAIAIDPAHGGLDTGVIAPDGYNEKLVTFEVADRLARLLRMRLGVPVYVSRSGDYDVTLDQRLEAALRDDVDLWILVHAQASFSSDVRGIDLLVRAQEESSGSSHGSLVLAQQLSQSMLASDLAVRGIFPSSRLSLGRGNLPTVQLEIGYLSNPDELRLLRQADYQTRLVQSVFEGIQNYISLSGETR